VVTYDKAGGSRVQVIRNNPTSHITGTRTLTTAWAVPAVHRSYITRTAGSSRWEWINGAWSARTNTAETWHPTNGRLVDSRDEGNANVAGDETCTRYSYADNAATHKFDFVSQVQTTKKRCNDTPSLPADLVSDERYFYDGLAHGGAPGRGNVTKTEAYVDNRWIIAAQGVSYDPYGRVRSSTDGLNRTTTTAYTHNADGLLSSLLVTNPAGHQTSTTLDVQRGAPLTATDANGKTVTAQYDPLGRLIKMWGPGRPTTATPDAEYAYQLQKDAPTWVSTKTLGPAGQQLTSYEIYDGALRPRQTQVPTSAGGRAVTDTVYDARGLAAGW
jgi:YD repeat-containing protein